MKRQGLGSLYTFTFACGSTKKHLVFHNYDEENIDINPLGQIIVSTALSAIIAINSPAAPDASSA